MRLLAFFVVCMGLAIGLDFKVFQGEEIRGVLKEVSRLRIEIFRDPPFFYEGDVDDDVKYLEGYAGRGIVILVYDGDEVVAARTGVPLKDAYKEAAVPFVNAGLNVDDYFYLGEIVVKPAYRRQGLARQLYDMIEEMAKERYPKVCFCTVVRENAHVLSRFWKGRGYTERHDLETIMNWKEVGGDQEIPHTMRFWTK